MNVQSKVIVVALDKKFKKMEKPLKKVVFNLLSKLFLPQKNAVEIYLVGNKFMNKNVLAFPAPKNFPRPDLRGKKWLGEIYLNPDYIRKEKLSRLWRDPAFKNFQKKAAGEIASKKLAYMFIHGFLHLLGYDHKKESDRIKMEKRERRLLE